MARQTKGTTVTDIGILPMFALLFALLGIVVAFAHEPSRSVRAELADSVAAGPFGSANISHSHSGANCECHQHCHVAAMSSRRNDFAWPHPPGLVFMPAVRSLTARPPAAQHRASAETAVVSCRLMAILRTTRLLI